MVKKNMTGGGAQQAQDDINMALSERPDLRLFIEEKDKLGEGGYGDVYLATNGLNEKLAVKEVHKAKMKDPVLLNEVRALDALGGLKRVIGKPDGYPSNIGLNLHDGGRPEPEREPEPPPTELISAMPVPRISARAHDGYGRRLG